jgi:undecaprenyl phosphate-alpha-L-ara4N flippase subunit ArnF
MSRNNFSWVGVAHLSISIIASALAQLFMKAGMVALRTQIDTAGSLMDSGAVAWVIGGLICYGISLVAWLRVLSAYPLSFAYPLLGISYLLVFSGAVIWPRLGEPFSTSRLIGSLLVVAGVMLVTGSHSADQPADDADRP